MAMTVEFVDQLPKRSVNRVHQVNEELKAISKALAQRPGSFARIASKTPSFGSFYGLKELGCELTLRNVGTEDYEKNGETKSRRLYDVYARFIVPEEPEKPAKKGGKKSGYSTTD
jgi:hypothetical protein